MQRYHWSVKPPNYNRIRFHHDLAAIQPEPDYYTRQFEMGSTASSFKRTSLRWGHRPNNKMLYHLMLSIENEHQNNQLQKFVPILVFHLTLALIRIKNKIGTLQIDMSCMASFLIS